ncbi:MAG: chromosomal replication initiator protein DnaA [Clostridia bacterium]|nr:chromosomal replication initiator protein DnaA [Clostridia bacterium]
MDYQQLWKRACDDLSREMNTYVYKTLIEQNLLPVAIEEGVFIAQTRLPGMKALVESQHAPRIEALLTQAAGKPMRLQIYTKEELDRRTAGAAEKSPAQENRLQLNPAYTFENFVVGSANMFAHAAAVAVAASPSEAYNPLFIYGGVGLGKTHLMHAIGHYVQQQFPEKRLLYITSETFTNELINAIKLGQNMEFRRRMRSVDVLMVDDIQFIAGRESTQEEFFHTFNELYNEHKQIILTSDRPPQEIARLEERLRSRFSWGLLADIQKPDVETREAILRDKAKDRAVEVPDEVIALMAEHIDSNIRELEGGLNKLLAYANLVHQPLSESLCREALREVFSQNERRVLGAETVIARISEYYSIDRDALTGPSRKREITVPRQIAMFLARELTGLSLPQIGLAFGGRDHTTVMHACATVSQGILNDAAMRLQVNDLRAMLTGK